MQNKRKRKYKKQNNTSAEFLPFAPAEAQCWNTVLNFLKQYLNLNLNETTYDTNWHHQPALVVKFIWMNKEN